MNNELSKDAIAVIDAAVKWADHCRQHGAHNWCPLNDGACRCTKEKVEEHLRDHLEAIARDAQRPVLLYVGPNGDEPAYEGEHDVL